MAVPDRTNGRDSYPPIADYALIGDCHSSALMSKSGSIDWCCMPRFDSDSCFGRLLDWGKAGYFAITPRAAEQRTTRSYEKNTLILVTTFHTASGDARLYDFFAMREGGRTHPRRQLLRILEGLAGEVAFSVDFVPRFDYGDTDPWIFPLDPRGHAAVGSNHGLVISGDVALEKRGLHELHAPVSVRAGERLRLSVQFVAPEQLEQKVELPAFSELDARFEETREWWRNWSGKIASKDRGGPGVTRSAIVLKALNYAPTGAIIAAPTTSLPESLEGGRNWDYRFSWVRDSIFTVHALADLGAEAEADGFRRFIQRSAAGNADDLQVLYAIDGNRRLPELELDHLEGYRGIGPVRVGNRAERQFQADVYGLVVELAWRWAQRTNSPTPAYWEFLVDLINTAGRRWREPDEGIWETRSPPRHFVHSKVMCWVALERGIALAEKYRLAAPLERWQAARNGLCHSIETRGYDSTRGIFVQAFGMKALDASLLLLPKVRFIDYTDERMVRTVEAIRQGLDAGGLILRYRTEDGLPGTEGVFLACSFWLAECLARQGRYQEAKEIFDRVVSCANDVGLFPEQCDRGAGKMLGNFPQALTHLSHISAALALTGKPRGPSRLV